MCSWAGYPDYTVCSSGCDFTTLQGAVSDITTNHAVLTSPVTITISGTWGSPDTTLVNITGITTTSSNTITITTTGSARHNGTVGGGGYILRSGSGTLISISANTYVTIDGIILNVNNPSADSYNGIHIANYTSSAKVYIKNSIIYATSVITSRDNVSGISINRGCAGNNSGLLYFYNNIIYGFKSNQGTMSGIYSAADSGGSIFIYNNTLYNNSKGISGTCAAPKVLKNNISYSNTTDYSLTPSSSSTNNLSKDATAPAFNTYYRNATLTFQNTGAGTENLLLYSTDSQAIDKGANLSSDSSLPFSIDIISSVRPYGVTWDIGANEYIYYLNTSIINNATVNNATIN